MRLLLYVFTAIGCLALAAISFVLVAAPTEAIERQLIAAFKARTGRELVVHGGATLSFYPVAGITLTDISVSGPQDAGDEPLLKIGKLRLKVPLWPLLRRQLVVEELIVERPQVRLITGTDGSRNWQFDARPPLPAGDESVAVAGTGEEAASSAVDGTASASAADGHLAGLSLGDVRVIDGTVEVEDRRHDRHESFSEINVQLNLDSVDRPLNLSGSLRWRDRNWPLELGLSSMMAALAGEPAALKLTTSADVAAFAFEGDISFADDLRLSGTAEIRAPSLRRLIEFAGMPTPQFGGLAALSLAGKLELSNRVASFTDATLSLDGWSARGKVSVPLDAPRPSVEAEMAVDRLDLNPYLAAAPPDLLQAMETADSADQPVVDAVPPAEEATAAAESGDWSDVPNDFSALQSVDITAKLTLESLVYRNIKLDRSSLAAKLSDGLLTVKFDRLALYSGSGSGGLGINSRQGAAKIALAADLAGIDSRPLLRDALAVDWLAGRGTMSFKLSAIGDSVRSWMASLAGAGKVSFREGAIVGFNLPQTIRGLEQGRLDGLKTGSTAKTDFSELDATFTVAEGEVGNKDLRLAGPLLRLTGAGTVLLLSRSLDYVARPKLVASLEGQGGDTGLAGIEIPVKLTGPWRRPRLTPDLTAVLRDPKATAEAAKKIGETLKGSKGVKKLLDQLGDEKTKAKINEALGKLLGNSD